MKLNYITEKMHVMQKDIYCLVFMEILALLQKSVKVVTRSLVRYFHNFLSGW